MQAFLVLSRTQQSITILNSHFTYTGSKMTQYHFPSINGRLSGNTDISVQRLPLSMVKQLFLCVHLYSTTGQ